MLKKNVITALKIFINNYYPIDRLDEDPVLKVLKSVCLVLSLQFGSFLSSVRTFSESVYLYLHGLNVGFAYNTFLFTM